MLAYFGYGPKPADGISVIVVLKLLRGGASKGLLSTVTRPGVAGARGLSTDQHIDFREYLVRSKDSLARAGRKSFPAGCAGKDSVLRLAASTFSVDRSFIQSV